MMPLKTKMCLAAALVSLCAGGVLVAYLFRTETLDNSALGLIYYRYRWGRAHELWADTNRDGSINFRSRSTDPNHGFGSHVSPVEYWEDWDYDGVFEIHVVLDGPIIQRLELDEDADGEYERVLTGEEALGFYESRFGSESKSDP